MTFPRHIGRKVSHTIGKVLGYNKVFKSSDEFRIFSLFLRLHYISHHLKVSLVIDIRHTLVKGRTVTVDLAEYQRYLRFGFAYQSVIPE